MSSNSTTNNVVRRFFDYYCGHNNRLWDINLTWNTNNPDFTQCFQGSVLVWIPSSFLFFFTIYELIKAQNSNYKDIPSTWLNIGKMTGISSLIFLQTFELCYLFFYLEAYIGYQIYPLEIFSPIIKILSFFVVGILEIRNKKRGIQSSGVLFFYWLLLLICDGPTFRNAVAISHPQKIEKFNYLVPIVIEVVTFMIIVAEFLLSCWADVDPLENPEIKLSKKPSPEKGASFINKIIFFWFEGLCRKGYSKTLDFNDIWDLSSENSTKTISTNFSKLWNQALDKAKKKLMKEDGKYLAESEISVDFKHQFQYNKLPQQKHSITYINIMPVLIKMFGSSIFFGALIKLSQDILTFVSPQILNLLIGFIGGNEERWKGYFYAIILFVVAVLGSLIGNQYFYKMFLIGMRMKTTVVCAIYEKALRISNSARDESTMGEIVNLMSVDAQRLVEICSYINILWSSPLQIALSLYFLWGILGPSVISGLLVMILLIPINGIVANKTKKLQFKQMAYKDQRIKLMSEILSGIKVLKLYAWEPSYEEQVMKIRNNEIKVLKEAAYLNAAFSFIWSCAPFLVSVVTFATYVLIDENNVLDPQKAFVSLTLFNIMRMPINLLPMMIVYLIQAIVSVKRINKFLNAEEIDENAVGHNEKEADVVIIQNGSFRWKKDDPPVLRNINLRIKQGSLVAIVGTVGVGKSSLLSAMLGEIEKVSGRVNVIGSVAYVAQQAWIQNKSLRDNILFGLPLDSYKYDKVIKACALKPDIRILPAGDRTEIGEKGINLSGGQKQRVSLARAAYNYGDLYLLDDPLSAVDSHVGKHLFDNVIGPKGLLKNKTRILVTHGITFLPQVDEIIVIKDNEISETGTYKELLAKKGDFADFLVQHLSLTKEEELEEIESIENIVKDLKDILGENKVENIKRQISTVSDTKSDQKTKRKTSSIMSASIQKSFHQSVEDNENVNKNNKLIEAESMEIGSVKLSVLTYYLKSIGLPLALLVALFRLLFECFSVGSNLWLTAWSNQNAGKNGTVDTGTRDLYLGVYGAFGIGQGIAVLVASLIMASATLKASSHLHFVILQRILRAPMSFFDTTPLGRIVNRFSKDVDTADNALYMTINFWLSCLFTVSSTLIVISYTTPIFIAVIVPISIFYFFAQRYYVATMRQLKRMESVTRSPIFSHFSETLAGTMTIRAYGMQKTFINESHSKVDLNQTCYFPSIVSSRFLAVCLEFIGNIVILFSALFAVISSETINPGLVGLSISYALQITTSLNWLVKMTSDVETNLVSVERIKEYSQVPQEAEWEIPDAKPARTWPESGEIIFKNYETRYRDGLDLVLKNITCRIHPSEKVGIVGRTGAGKSSLTLALFRIIEASSGHILIDNENISKIGLHDVRKRLTVIPQDPVIFSGTLRMNLDPFEYYSDGQIWRALELAHLKPYVKGLSASLEHQLTEGGENLSAGQRQLVCLARAILRKTKILILDEATAAVDLETDDLIQETIRSEFKDSTVVTIAHRINTILDYTRVMVIDKGSIVEFDSPKNLLKNKNSIFYSMAKDSGIMDEREYYLQTRINV